MFKKILPLIVLTAMGAGAWLVLTHPPEVNRSPRPAKPAMSVAVETIQPRDYQITINRYGRVQARQRTTLTAEAAGEVIYVAPELRAGGRFSQGTLLLQLDDARYRAELSIAQATLTESLQNYADQQAQTEQAAQAWRLSGQEGEPSDRVLRKPQLKAAAAQVESARSSVRLARLSLDKTRVIAPFDGQVASVSLEQGQAISSGSEIATLIANRLPEIEVSLHQSDLTYLALDQQPEATVIDGATQYSARLTRTAAELNPDNLQLAATLNLTGTAVDALSEQVLAQQPRVGDLLQAQIQGRQLQDVIVVPNQAVYQSRYVYKVVDGRLQLQEVTLGWQDDDFSVVQQGLQPGDQLVLTPLGQVASGTLVSLRTPAEQGEADPKAEKTEKAESRP